MQQQETIAAGRRAVAPVQLRHPVARRVHQRFVAIDVLAVGVGPIGEQGEVQVAGQAGQMMDFQPLDAAPHRLK